MKAVEKPQEGSEVVCLPGPPAEQVAAGRVWEGRAPSFRLPDYFPNPMVVASSSVPVRVFVENGQMPRMTESNRIFNVFIS